MPKSSFRSPSPRWPCEEPRPGRWHVHLGAPQCRSAVQSRRGPLVPVMKGTHVSVKWSGGSHAEPCSSDGRSQTKQEFLES